MKEAVGAMLCVFALALMGYNEVSKNPVTSQSREEAVSNTVSREQSNNSISTISGESSQESTSYVSETSVQASQMNLPDGLFWDSENESIKYVTPDMKIRVYFPDDFCNANTGYQPDNGIFLATRNGTATLLIDTMKAQNVTVNTLVDFLKSKYDDGAVYIMDNKDVVCERNYVDDTGREQYCFLKIRITKGGYFEVAVTCPPSQKTKYSHIFERIQITTLQL